MRSLSRFSSVALISPLTAQPRSSFCHDPQHIEAFEDDQRDTVVCCHLVANKLYFFPLTPSAERNQGVHRAIGCVPRAIPHIRLANRRIIGRLATSLPTPLPWFRPGFDTVPSVSLFLSFGLVSLFLSLLFSFVLSSSFFFIPVLFLFVLFYSFFYSFLYIRYFYFVLLSSFFFVVSYGMQVISYDTALQPIVLELS